MTVFGTTVLRRAILASCVALAAAMLPGASRAADKLHLIVVTHGQAGDSYWSSVKLGVDAGAKQMDVDVRYEAPQTFDMGAMAKLIQAATAAHPDGLVVSIPDPDALGPAIKQAVAAGIPVVAIDSGLADARKLGALTFMGQEEYDAGVATGERMKVAGITNALCLNHEVGNADLDHRCEGFAKGLGGKTEVIAISEDPTESKNRILSALATRKDVNGLLALGASGAVPLLQALDSPGIAAQIKGAGSFDLSPEILAAVDQGKLLFGIDEQPYLLGYLPIVFLKLYHDYRLMPAVDVNTGPSFVTKADANTVLELSKQGIR